MQYILVTGAYGGMGSAATKLLLQKGYAVIALDRNIGAEQDNLFPVEVDVTDEESIISAFQKVKSITDELYAIVHFAGIYMLDSLVEMDTKAFDKIFGVNFRGVYLINKMFLPLLRKGSRILITTSELAPLDPLPFTGIYAVTKGALDKYAYSLSMELQLLGIKVSVLRAGAVDTNMIGASTDALESFVKNTSLYKCNADRFKKIVERVEARKIKPEVLGNKVAGILHKRNPKFAYSINRNPLLLFLNVMPKKLQLYIIKLILK